MPSFPPQWLLLEKKNDDFLTYKFIIKEYNSYINVIKNGNLPKPDNQSLSATILGVEALLTAV